MALASDESCADPQMDLQAQDRVHRIGQLSPVLVFRLVTANTVESTILQRAGAKRKLEALVIGQGTFSKAPSTSADDMAEILSGRTKRKTANMAELAELLLRNEGETVHLVDKDDELLSQEQLETLLDRSVRPACLLYSSRVTRRAQPEAMSREPGYKAGAIEVFETKVQDEAGVRAQCIC
jgi:ATP-dependent DNA helicase